jgi:prefoldin subunit 5
MAAPDATPNAQFAAVADAVQADMADGQRKIEELNAVAQQLANGYSSLVAQVGAAPAAPAGYRAAVARAHDSPARYRSTVARAVDDDDALDSVGRSLETLEKYLDTLKEHLPAHAQRFHELGLESYKEFKKMLHRGEDALCRAYGPPGAAAAPEPSPIGDLIKAAVDEVMAEA